jgi:hypothetical protein
MTVAITTNPFATRWTRPGAIPFDFGGRCSVDELVRRLANCDWRGAIVGPHGSGKSTLVRTLIPALEAAGRGAVLITLCDGQKRLPLSLRRLDRQRGRSIVVIDGYEQLGRLPRWRLQSHCRRRGYGLLVTAHGHCGLPALFRTGPDLAMIERVVEQVLPPHGGRIRRSDLERAWRRHGENVRELLFELYDLFETRRRL